MTSDLPAPLPARARALPDPSAATGGPGAATTTAGARATGGVSGTRRLHLPRIRTSLARRFLVANLVVLVLAGIVIGVWVGDELERGIIARTAAITTLYVESFIEPSLDSMVTGQPLTAEEIGRLDALLTDSPLGQKIVALRVWSPDGTIAYSPTHERIGQRFPVEGGLAEALAGEVGAEMSSLSAAENAPERAQWDRLLEMYLPVRERGADRIIAVAEFYQLPTDIDTEVGEARRSTWLVIAIAIALTAALLFGIVKQGSDTIASQEAALTRQVGELSELLRQNEALGERVRVAADRATTINERALRRISSDLHDGPGQTLSLSLMRLDALREQSAAGTPPAAAELGDVERALQDAMRDMRAIAAGLRMPELAPLSVADAASRAVQDHRRRTGTDVELQLGDLPADVPLSVKITCYRALQELLSNATRHGGGTAVRVRLDAPDETLRLEVADGGPGFDPRKLEQSTGLGLPGMHEQAELLGGGFRVRSAAGQGTTVTVWWPLHAGRPSGEASA
ncbi:MAG: sensor histidine kinase [Chloroflexota bacterium]